jgi:hypothetical protein
MFLSVGPQHLQEKVRILSQIRLMPIPSMFFTIYYSLMIVTFDGG